MGYFLQKQKNPGQSGNSVKKAACTTRTRYGFPCNGGIPAQAPHPCSSGVIFGVVIVPARTRCRLSETTHAPTRSVTAFVIATDLHTFYIISPCPSLVKGICEILRFVHVKFSGLYSFSVRDGGSVARFLLEKSAVLCYHGSRTEITNEKEKKSCFPHL